MSSTPFNFQKNILSWFDKHGRKHLPWQQAITPYRVWVSEIMLQQTQVNTVINYFQRFMQRFPDIYALAAAPLDDVLQLWAGLGYYARARNLQRCAQIIVQNYNGEFPQNLADLQSLPGIGRSTAGAILAIAMQKQAAILDGNVKRVLSRFFAIEGAINDNKTMQELWQIAEEYTPQKSVANYTQAMMDLGAMICLRSKPHCDLCPLQADCLAYKTHRTHELPHKNKKKNLTIRQTFMLILQNAEQAMLLERRPPNGIWGGLWSFPECADENDFSIMCEKQYGCQLISATKLAKFRHIFSHFHLDITPVLIRTASLTNQIMEERDAAWYSYQQAQQLGIPQPVKHLLLTLGNQHQLLTKD